MFCSKVLYIIGKSFIFIVKNNDNCTFLIFFVFNIVFPLELETRLYYLPITISTDTSPTQMDCNVAGHENEFCSKLHFMIFEIGQLSSFSKCH